MKIVDVATIMDRPATPHGLHHITMICRDAQANIDFYTGILGLRFVKRTVNFDDPSAYHLYYGDAVASPGTLLTFFPYPGGRPLQRGDGAADRIVLSIGKGSTEFWRERLAKFGVTHAMEDGRLTADDPDGLWLEFEEVDEAFDEVFASEAIPAEHAIRRVLRMGLRYRDPSVSRTFFQEVMGLDPDLYFSYSSEGADNPGNGAPGSVHHIALRLKDDESQAQWIRWLRSNGVMVTDVRDRFYFHSIYFREPGGVLIELATDGPGFDTDEPMDKLGESLVLPPMHEAKREMIERSLPAVTIPEPRV